MEKYLFVVSIGGKQFYREMYLSTEKLLSPEEFLEDTAITFKDEVISDYMVSAGVESYKYLPEVDYSYEKLNMFLVWK